MAARTAIKIAAVVLALVLVACAWIFTPISQLANPEAVTAAMGAVAASPWRFAIVLGCYLVAGIVVFPVLLLMFACAAVFGPVTGFAYSTAGLLASAALNYGIGAWLGRGVLMEKLGPRFEAARLALMQRGLTTTAVVRAIPGSPFALVSIAAGASDIRFLDYLIGTAIGIMVPVSVMTVASDQTFRLLAEPNVMHFAVLAGVIALWFAIAFGAQALAQRIAKNRSRGAN
ncbi:MAG: VTT domain-containing protein [Hyphomicrobiaceae bacterium]|jgi:phospholipase D1/2